jgi:predicted TIM-barrel fold metal-dependent hydrolase
VRIVALEEHFLVPSLIDEHIGDAASKMDWLTPALRGELADLGAHRLQDMDASGISLQVISAGMPGADLLDGAAGVRFAMATNDRLAQGVRAHPGRFAGFAHLPMREPLAAADELERAVTELGFHGAMINGLTQGRFLDDPRFAPILERAASLDVPIYLHPNLPPEAVFDAYYRDLPGNSGALLASGLFGWHSETAIHVFRLALSGTLERYPGLNFIVGHMGEMLPFMLARADDVLSGYGDFGQPISDVIRERVYLTTSGFFTLPPFLIALMTFGASRILFSVDHPFSKNARGAAFLRTLPVSPADLAAIAHGNAERLLRLAAPT